jgi:hypothetical protein
MRRLSFSTSFLIMSLFYTFCIFLLSFNSKITLHSVCKYCSFLVWYFLAKLDVYHVATTCTFRFMLRRHTHTMSFLSEHRSFFS